MDSQRGRPLLEDEQVVGPSGHRITYGVPFRFTGHVDNVPIDVGDVAKADQEAVEAAERLARARKGARD